MAASINKRDPAVKQALARVNTTHPLTPGAGVQVRCTLVN